MRWAPISLHLLGAGLNEAGDSGRGRDGAAVGPAAASHDVWLNYELGGCWRSCSRRDEAIRFYTAARAIRPETAHELAHALESAGRVRRGHRRVPRSQAAAPGNARHLGCLGLLKEGGCPPEAGRYRAAAAAGREAIRLKPDVP